ncbi:MAG TPA: peptidase S10 [Alphaproteobacteria bacterium]
MNRWFIGWIWVLIAALLALPPAPAPAQEGTAGQPAAATASARAETQPNAAVTEHAIEVDGVRLVYTATVAALPVADGNGTTKAYIYYTSYVAKDDSAGRPLTFVFNGGPGASSAYLHLGALGPRRVALNDDGTAPVPPATTTANPSTWLSFTDLVFVDPVGTGFSRPVQVDGKTVPNDAFWGVDEDVEWSARFIRRYLSDTKRWNAPKFLVGESYGGFRVAKLADTLPTRYGIGLNGIVMISPALEFGLFRGDDRFTLWPAVLRLPSLAAVAWRHGRAGTGERSDEARDRFLTEVEAFSLKEMLPALAQGGMLPADAREAVYGRIAAYTGLALDTVARADGRVSRETFIKELLAGDRRVIGRYDGSVSIPDPNPAEPRFRDTDPTLGGLTAPFLTAMNAYLRNELGFVADAPYVLLNSSTSANWNWGSAQRGGTNVGSGDDLRSAMASNRALRVLIAHGRFDLVTPYFASIHVVNQIKLDPARRKDLTVRLYDGGHMMYLHKAERTRLFEDARAFFAASVPRMD